MWINKTRLHTRRRYVRILSAAIPRIIPQETKNQGTSYRGLHHRGQIRCTSASRRRHRQGRFQPLITSPPSLRCDLSTLDLLALPLPQGATAAAFGHLAEVLQRVLQVLIDALLAHIYPRHMTRVTTMPPVRTRTTRAHTAWTGLFQPGILERTLGPRVSNW